jgi:hypothetical protein
MKTEYARIAIPLLLISLLLGGCVFPETISDDIEVHFGRPAGGDVIMLGESMQLLANGESTAGDVSRVQFYVNGAQVGDRPNAYGAQIVVEMTWTPPAAGEYTLQLAAQRGREHAYSAPVKVCVLPFQIAPGHPVDIYAHGYDGDCSIPDRAASAIPGSPSLNRTSPSASSLTYVPNFFDTCPDQTRILQFKIYIDDPHDDVVFAAISLVVSPAFFGRISSEATLALTHLSGVAPNTKLFFGGMDVHIWLARSLTDPATGEGMDGTLNWTVRGFGRDGSTLINEGPFGIPVTPVNCDGSAAALAAPTSTPASALDCPSGTYFAPVTNRCIAIQMKPDDGGNDGGSCKPPPGGCGTLNWYPEPYCYCFE